MNCPGCDSSRFYYVQRVYEYHDIESVNDDNVDLSYLNDVAIDEDYEAHLYCDDCGGRFDTGLNVLILEDDEPNVPARLKVTNEN